MKMQHDFNRAGDRAKPMSTMGSLARDTKRAIGNMLHARLMQPGHRQFYLAQVADHGRNAAMGYSDEDHLRAAADWLRAAQDSQSDGGFSGRYKLDKGWTSSYPETTGYLIPTCLALAERLSEPEWGERAARAMEFLLGLQLENGAFPGGEVAENTVEPSPFNTAQILNGLNIWAAEKKDADARSAAERAAAWLVSVQDDDGAFRQHFYLNQPSAYAAHLSCWLAEYGVLFDDKAARKAAEKHLDWVLALQDKDTGFFARSGFYGADHDNGTAVTHTIAYTIWGVLLNGLLLGREDAVDAAELAAAKIMERMEILKFLPGRLNSRWRIDERAQCLTGNAQMALIWLRLYDERGDLRFVNAACRAIDLVKQAQPMDNPNPGLRGGVAGSFPVWGGYIFHAVPNWAAKFFIDALMHKERVLTALENG
ncbi:prenyltransferase/squalene oxidase repeat-containing protein [Alterisphingorhabdus coralli]|uniref:Prenyltransferase/squalene oxidase repeat-containing protein n=1 Tax=Alterisphingorhabdus coralli TaxID=3071408 RepID=A0AA97F560_9SPHN|nr:prenyltransferase/squalene oxidase repeat-containing protein [Parasphingorhabdus sp. SCSIO 66989]WOE74411.1 prenyltransferase/squalene oxidase repeat-containing protein [Parasphingorhabdus sp. SCSIO 66989]